MGVYFRPLFLLFVAGFLLLTACAPGGVELVNETDEKQYQLAKNFQSQGRTAEALSAFLRVIDTRRDAPESHLEAGYIFLREMKDPVRAIYHFDRYLQFSPQSPQVAQVRQLIETARKEFARQLPAQPYQGELDRIDLMDLVKSLRQENESLKAELVTAENRVKQLEARLGGGAVGAARAPAGAVVPGGTSRQSAEAPAPRAAPTPAAAAPGPTPATAPRVYTVQSGDSLSGISRQVYGTPSRWIDIYQANRDRLPSENSLRVGQELRIP